MTTKLTRYVVSVTEDGPGYLETDDYGVAATQATLDRAIVLEQQFELVSQEIALDKRSDIQIPIERTCWHCNSHVMGDTECSVCGADALITRSKIPAVREFVKEAAKALLSSPEDGKRAKHIGYDQGNWWATDTRSGRRWKAIDADGPGSHYGIGFKEVSGGKRD